MKPKCVSLNHFENTGFPQYLKVELASENFCKLKWLKVKKQLPLIYTENFSSVPRHKK